MNNREMVQKLWNLCNILRDDGITYHQYVTELTYLLFLKMMKETGQEYMIPEKYRWDSLVEKDGAELKGHYARLLTDLGKEENQLLRQIYHDAKSNIRKPENLRKIIQSINHLDWYNAKQEGLGDLYEGLLEKNASEFKSGAGQYFTPRVLVNVMVELVDPQPGERCHDPAAGTFGFMVAAARHVREQTGQYSRLSDEEVKFQKYQAFSGVELVPDTHRLAVMNALLHDIHGEILLGDTLSPLGERLKNFDVILTNPPFGTKKGGERVKRNDFTFQTANKQLNFLQHVYRALKPDGKARAAVVVPDNVLFEEGIGADIRRELMEMCNLHTILRLPTGIFYAPGVKTNVLFFTRGEKDTGNTKEVWVYDLRTDMPSFGKRNPLTREHFTGFIRAYTAEDRRQVKDERWNVFTREEIAKNGDNLDIGLLSFAPLYNPEKLPDPIAKSEEAVEKLGMAISLINEVIAELKAAEQRGRR
ncbi:MAG: SAM-dependent methyltransferase [Caldibacillus debilis]|jgi:type I restriction enzyme M protein|nr:type I restriction-modification system subunit M [Caldibacillus debilis]MBO2481606.1 SAM-dependent methyltransferase [Bacillaceae bacterium]REJ17360.1 MAG: SAM-dependent methyltransferase [Caldibacillus debilis]REJ26655.1 MAG: SAM-dependent methyltransferase [Caldibacillus debilis]